MKRNWKKKNVFVLQVSSAKSSLSHKQHKEEALNKKYNLNQTPINSIQHNKNLKSQPLGIG